MLSRLMEQRWPTKVCHWIKSFLSGRVADIIMDGTTGEETQLSGSLPQGSPISPVLFMLFMAPLYREVRGLRGWMFHGGQRQLPQQYPGG